MYYGGETAPCTAAVARMGPFAHRFYRFGRPSCPCFRVELELFPEPIARIAGFYFPIFRNLIASHAPSTRIPRTMYTGFETAPRTEAIARSGPRGRRFYIFGHPTPPCSRGGGARFPNAPSPEYPGITATDVETLSHRMPHVRAFPDDVYMMRNIPYYS